MKGVKENRIGGILYNKVENLAGYKRDSEINPMKVVDALFTMQKKVGIFSKIHAYVFIISCLPFYQNTPGIYQFTPAFDEKTPAFRDTQNQVVFKKM